MLYRRGAREDRQPATVHDWREVTELGPALDEPPALEDAAGEPGDAALERAWVWCASAGSCPVTSNSVISSQVATNRATIPATTRRRIIRTRA